MNGRVKLTNDVSFVAPDNALDRTHINATVFLNSHPVIRIVIGEDFLNIGGRWSILPSRWSSKSRRSNPVHQAECSRVTDTASSSRVESV